MHRRYVERSEQKSSRRPRAGEGGPRKALVESKKVSSFFSSFLFTTGSSILVNEGILSYHARGTIDYTFWFLVIALNFGRYKESVLVRWKLKPYFANRNRNEMKNTSVRFTGNDVFISTYIPSDSYSKALDYIICIYIQYCFIKYIHSDTQHHHPAGNERNTLRNPVVCWQLQYQ